MSPVNPRPPPRTLLGGGSGEGNGDSKAREAQVGGNLWPSSPTHAAAGGGIVEGEVGVRGRI
jgi:hypothetical protein